MRIHKVLKSTAVSEIGYDRDLSELWVTFRSKTRSRQSGRYVFKGVGKDQFTALNKIRSSKKGSVGNFISTQIVGNYDSELVA